LNPAKPVICNTTLLSNFAVANRVDILTRALARPLFTTPQVVDEITAGVQAGYSHLGALESQLLAGTAPFTILSLDTAELPILRDLRVRLHAGEASCLAIAIHRSMVLGTDDLAARKIAKTKQVPVIGTVAAVVLCRHGLLSLDEANEILQQMIDAGYRSPVSRLDEFWR